MFVIAQLVNPFTYFTAYCRQIFKASNHQNDMGVKCGEGDVMVNFNVNKDTINPHFVNGYTTTQRFIITVGDIKYVAHFV